MAQTTYNGTTYTHETKIPNVGFGFSIATTAKAPAISKRIFGTFNEASGYTSNVNDTACAGLLLTVTGDTNPNLNGLYTVMSGGTAPTGLELKRASGQLTINGDVTPTSGYLKTYEFTTNGQLVGKIDIPKDFLVKSASSYIVKAGSDAATKGNITVGHTCLDLVVNTVEGDAEAQHTYVDLTEALGQHHHASAITATELTNADLGFTGADDEPNKVFISGNTVAQQLQSIGIQIKNHRGRVSSSGQTEQILTLYDDGIGIVSGATWDCGEW
jgi:hypothetical protein